MFSRLQTVLLLGFIYLAQAHPNPEISEWLLNGSVSLADSKFLFDFVPEPVLPSPPYYKPTSILNLLFNQLDHSNPFERPQLLCNETLAKADPVKRGLAYFWRLGGTPRDFHKALAEFELSARQGNSYGMFMAGVMHATGCFGNIPKDEAKAVMYYHLGAEAGCAEAQIALAQRFRHGFHVEQNDFEALKYFNLAGDQILDKLAQESPLYTRQSGTYWSLSAESGLGLYGLRAYRRVNKNTASSIPLGPLSPANKLITSILQSPPPTLAETIEELEYRCSEENDVSSMYVLALLHQLGAVDGSTIPNWTRAVHYARRCLAHTTFGFESQFSLNEVFRSKCLEFLGNRYLRGQGVDQNIERSIKFFDEAQQSRSGVALCSQCEANKIVAQLLLQNCTYDAKLQAVKAAESLDFETFGIDYTLPMLIYEMNKEPELSVELLRSTITGTQYRAPAASLILAKHDVQERRLRRAVEGINAAADFYSPARIAHAWMAKGDTESAVLGFLVASELGTPTSALNLAEMLDVLTSFLSSYFPKLSDYTSSNFPFVVKERRMEEAFLYFAKAAKLNSLDAMLKTAEYAIHNETLATDREIDSLLDSASKFNIGMAHLMKAIRADQRGDHNEALALAIDAGVCPELWIPARVLRLKIKYGVRLVEVPVALLVVSIAMYFSVALLR